MKYRMKFDDAAVFQADLDAKDAEIVQLKREINASVEAERAACEAIAREHLVKFGPLDDKRRQKDAEMGAWNARHQIADAIAARGK